MALTLTLIARTTGSGWAMVIVSGMLAAFSIAAVWPALSLRRVVLSVEAPRDATVNRPVELVVTISRSSQPLKLRLLDPESEWVSTNVGSSGPVPVTPQHRGVLEAITVDVRCAAPLGLVWWRRRDHLTLAAPLEVGPEPIDTPLPPVLRGEVGDSRPPLRRSGSDGVRSVRDYVAGDPARLVHWKATARRGDLMVKELEDPEGSVLAIIVDLRGPDDVGRETAASRAAGMANAALRGGMHVVLLTAERAGPRVGPVSSAREIGRRLARAVASAPPEGPVPGAFPVRVAPERSHQDVGAHA